MRFTCIFTLLQLSFISILKCNLFKSKLRTWMFAIKRRLLTLIVSELLHCVCVHKAVLKFYLHNSRLTIYNWGQNCCLVYYICKFNTIALNSMNISTTLLIVKTFNSNPWVIRSILFFFSENTEFLEKNTSFPTWNRPYSALF